MQKNEINNEELLNQISTHLRTEIGRTINVSQGLNYIFQPGTHYQSSLINSALSCHIEQIRNLTLAINGDRNNVINNLLTVTMACIIKLITIVHVIRKYANEISKTDYDKIQTILSQILKQIINKECMKYNHISVQLFLYNLVRDISLLEAISDKQHFKNMLDKKLHTFLFLMLAHINYIPSLKSKNQLTNLIKVANDIKEHKKKWEIDFFMGYKKFFLKQTTVELRLQSFIHLLDICGNLYEHLSLEDLAWIKAQYNAISSEVTVSALLKFSLFQALSCFRQEFIKPLYFFAFALVMGAVSYTSDASIRYDQLLMELNELEDKFSQNILRSCDTNRMKQLRDLRDNTLAKFPILYSKYAPYFLMLPVLVIPLIMMAHFIDYYSVKRSLNDLPGCLDERELKLLQEQSSKNIPPETQTEPTLLLSGIITPKTSDRSIPDFPSLDSQIDKLITALDKLQKGFIVKINLLDQMKKYCVKKKNAQNLPSLYGRVNTELSRLKKEVDESKSKLKSSKQKHMVITANVMIETQDNLNLIFKTSEEQISTVKNRILYIEKYLEDDVKECALMNLRYGLVKQYGKEKSAKYWRKAEQRAIRPIEKQQTENTQSESSTQQSQSSSSYSSITNRIAEPGSIAMYVQEEQPAHDKIKNDFIDDPIAQIINDLNLIQKIQKVNSESKFSPLGSIETNETKKALLSLGTIIDKLCHNHLYLLGGKYEPFLAALQEDETKLFSFLSRCQIYLQNQIEPHDNTNYSAQLDELEFLMLITDTFQFVDPNSVVERLLDNMRRFEIDHHPTDKNDKGKEPMFNLSLY